jgi:predicted nucleic acid-binding protein
MTTVAKSRAIPKHRSNRPRSSSTPSITKTVEPGVCYIESSALVAGLLEGDAAVKASIRSATKRITSALAIAESTRAIVRARVAGRLSPEQERAAMHALQVFARRCDIMSVTDAVLMRVGRPFPLEPVRTLDAVHLATAEALNEHPALVTILTRDVRVRENAIALGHPVE